MFSLVNGGQIFRQPSIPLKEYFEFGILWGLAFSGTIRTGLIQKSPLKPFYLRFLHLLIYSNTISGHLVTSHHNPLQLASHRLTSNFILPHLIPLYLINPLKYYHLTPIIHLHRLTQSLSQVSLSHTCRHHISPS